MAFTPIDEEEIIDEPVAEEAKPRFIPIEDDEFFGIGGEEEPPKPVVAPETTEPVEAPESRFTPISEEEFFGLPEPTEPIPVTGEEGFLRQAADVPLKIGESINTSLRGLTDLFGADNAISQNLTKNSEWYRSLLSAQALEDEQEIGRILQEAENEGVLDQLGAGLEAFSVAPVDFVASGIGSLATFAATGVAGRAAALAGAARAGLTGAKAAQFVQRGVQATQLATGAAMGAGIVKGEIYQSVKDEMLAQGKTEEESKRIATEAQSYMGKNLDQILLGAGLGTIDAFTGAEKIIGKVLTKGGLRPDASRIGNIIKNGLTEAAPEFVQAAQEKFASNLALQREGANVPLTQGVFSQGALEGLVGLGMGVGAGAIEPRIQTPPTKEEVSAAAAETQDVARQNKDIVPATASLVEGEAEQILKGQAETPDQRVARLQREAQEAAGEIELEEEPPVSGLPAQPVTPTPEAPPVAPVAPVGPVVAEGEAQPITTTRTVEDAIRDKDTFIYNDQRGAVSVEDGVTVFRPFGTQDKFEIGINPNQTIGEIEGIQWARKGQTRTTPIESKPETATIIESQPDIAIDEIDQEESEFEVPAALIEIEKSKTLNDLADLFDTGDSKVVQEGKRARKVSQTPEYYRAVTPQQINLANRLIDNALRIIDALPITDQQKQGMAEPFLLLDQDINNYENNPNYQRYKASIRTEVRPAGQAGAFPETETEVAAGIRELEQRAKAEAERLERARVRPPVAPTPVEPPALAPLRRVAKAEQTEEDVSGLVGQGLVELYKGQPVITQAGLETLPEAERPRLTPEARKIQIDTRTSEAAAEAISKNLRIGVDQVPADVRMPAGWTLVGDVYVPPTPMAKIESFDVEALAEVDEDSDVFADVIKRKDEAKAAVVQKPEGSAFATQDEFRAAFDLRGEGHGRFATRLDLMVADGVITSDGRDLIMAVIYDNNTDDTFLNNMEMGSMRARATRSYGLGGVSRQTVQSAKGKAIGYKPLLKMMQNARQDLQIDEKTAQTLSTFWHEFGHAGYYSLLDKAQKSVVASAYRKTTKAQRIKFFESGVAAARQGDVTAQYYAKSETEWFAQSFAEYVLTQKSEQKALVPIFETILNKIKGVFGKLFSRKEGTPELNDIFEYIIQGKGYGSTKIWWNGLQLSLAPAVYGTRGAQPIDPDFSRRLVEREKQNRARARRSITPQPEARESRVARDPEVQKAAQDLKAGTIDRDEYQRIVDMRMPLRKFEAVPTPANNDDMLRGLGERKAGERLKKDLIQDPEAIAEGTVLEARLDIPAYESENVWVVSLHKQRTDLQKGTAAEVVAYTPTSVLRNVTFGVTEKAAAGIAAGKPKSTIATMRGEYVPMTAEQAYELATTNKEQWVEIGMNPVRHSYFYDKDTQTPVESAEEVVQVGGMVLAKNPVFGKREDYLYSLREAQPTVGMTTDAVRARLEALGFGVEGMIRIVEDPQAAFEGRTIIQDGKAVRIELNASALNDNAAIDRVLNHEFAEAANADGALNKLVERLTPKEKKEINDAITRLGYEENVRTTEEAARAIETLAAGWKGRGFFEMAVARVEAWGSKLGLKLTRRAAEYIAARNLSDINAGFKAAYNRFINVKGEAREGRAFVAPEENARFMELAKDPEANREELQGMVDDAATKAGYNVSEALFRGFAKRPKPDRFITRRGRSVPSFTPIQEVANLYQYSVEFFLPQKGKGSRLYKFYSQINKPLDLREYGTRANLWDIVSSATNWDFTEKPKSGTWNVEDAQNLIYELWQKESNGYIGGENYDLSTADRGGFAHQTFKDLNEAIEEAEDPETIEYLLSGIEIDTYVLADSLEFVDAVRSNGYDGIIHKDTIEAGAEFLEETAGKPVTEIKGIDVEEDYSFDTYRPFEMAQTKLADPVTYDDQGNVIPLDQRFQPATADIRYSRTEIRESRREPAPTFTEESPEAKTLSNLKASMEKVDSASEAKGGKPETQKVSEIAANWMEQGGDERALQDAITENTNLTPANAARVAKAIARQYDIQQSIATAFLETQTGSSVEALPEGVTLPKEVDPDRPKPVMQRLFEAFMGVRVPPTKITVNEKAALKDQIRLKAAANRAAKAAQKETSDQVIEVIKAMDLRGGVRPKQAQALAKRAAKIIWTNEKSVETFIDYASKVVENANYDADLREAKAAQARAKQLSKQKRVAMSPQREMLENISKVAVNRLDDPRMYADVVNYYLRGFKAVLSPDYVVVPDSEMTSYLSQMQTEAGRNQRELDRAVNERLAEKYGVDIDDLNSVLEAADIISQLEANENREAMDSLLTEKAIETQAGLKAYDQTPLRPDQRKVIDSMMRVDPKALNAEERQRLIRITNNIIYNNQTNGAEYFVATAKGQQSAREASQDSDMIAKNKAWINLLPRLVSEKMQRGWALELQSVADTFRNAFGKGAMAKIYKSMGMLDLNMGFTKANNTIDEIQEKIAEFHSGLEKKYKAAARNQDGLLAEGVVGFLIQKVPNKPEADSIAQRKDLIRQDITNRRESKDVDRVAMADRIEAILNQVDGTSVQDILNKLKQTYPANHESLVWYKDTLLPQYKDFLRGFDENFNDQANNYENPDYLPIAFSKASPSLAITKEEEQVFYDQVSLRPKQAANTIKRVDYTTLPEDRSTNTPKEIEFNLRRNVFDSLSDQINKAYTSSAWQQLSAFMKTPEAETVFGGRANKDFFIERLNRLRLSRMRRGAMSRGNIERAVDSLSVISRKLGTGIALGGVYQWIKQPPDQIVTAIGSGGRMDLLAKNLAPSTQKTARTLLNKFSIGRRGDASAGYKYINQMEGHQNRLERYFSESKWDQVKEQGSKIADVWMIALKSSDFLAASGAWMTYYEGELNKRNIKIEDWAKEAELVDSDPARQEAAAFAEQMTDIYQGSSDPTQMATFAQSGKSGWENLIKAIFVPFNSFAVQQRMRLYSDARDAINGNKSGVGGLAGTIGGLLLFHATKRLVLPVISGSVAGVLYALLGVDMEEPDEDKQKEEANKRWRQMQGEMLGNLLVGGTPQIVEAKFIDAMNYASYMIALQLENESILNDEGEVMSFDQYAKERSPFWRYRSFDNAMSLGMLDIGLGQAEETLLQTKMVTDPEQMEMYTPEEQRLLYFSTLSEWMYLMRLNDADFARIVSKARRDMVSAAKEREKEMKRIREGR